MYTLIAWIYLCFVFSFCLRIHWDSQWKAGCQLPVAIPLREQRQVYWSLCLPALGPRDPQWQAGGALRTTIVISTACFQVKTQALVLCLCLSLWLFMCVFGVCAIVCKCMRRLEGDIRCCPPLLSLLLQDGNLSVNLELGNSARPAKEPPESCIWVYPPSARITRWPKMGFLSWVQEQNSDPHACNITFRQLSIPKFCFCLTRNLSQEN